MRLVSWNINGIRRIAKDQERRGLRRFADVLSHLDGDIVCLQELKSERATFDPAFVDVDGWRSYFTFPVDKKAYSGVAIYVREPYKPLLIETAICAPSYDRIAQDLIGGSIIGDYPTTIHVNDQRAIDREGRSIVLDFGGFVLFGLYCPAGAESEERVAYRQLFWRALDERLRNLVRSGREVVVMGDLNVISSAIDSVEADPKEYHYDHLGPVSRLFRNLTTEGVTALDVTGNLMSTLVPLSSSGPGERGAIFKDTGRYFHPDREGMYTCWSVKLSARAGNYGSRIDYVLATNKLMRYFVSADIRPDVEGSDHCPVYAELDESAVEPSLLVNVADADDVRESNFVGNQRKLTSLFGRTSSQSGSQPAAISSTQQTSTQLSSPSSQPSKRKDVETDTTLSEPAQKKQVRSIASFFGQSSPGKPDVAIEPVNKKAPLKRQGSSALDANRVTADEALTVQEMSPTAAVTSAGPRIRERTDTVEDRLATAQKFNSLFTKPEVPVCSGHNLPAKLQKTKKKGPNEGREFWMCPVDLGKGQCTFWRWRKR
ncbi:Class II abasic (AP) endonuclease [Savitreella phatthalungensis]